MKTNELFEKSFQRPTNYFYLDGQKKYEIDINLGLVNWSMENLTDEQKERFFAHYEKR